MSNGEPADLHRYRSKLEECLDRHEECRKAMERSQVNTAPTRLIYIQDHSMGQLHTVPQREYPRFAALSYCWGETAEQQKRANTTIANIDDRHRKIDFAELPKTIRDAVKVCRSLGLSFLWVDALCIVQDDEKDIVSEIAKMRSIYRGALITITAASATSSTEGFLEHRDLQKCYGSLIRLEYRYQGRDRTRKGSLLLSERPIKDTYQEPTDKRAWTMQEDILSLRLLKFGSQQTTWRCPRHAEGITLDGGSHPRKENEERELTVEEPYKADEVRSNMKKFVEKGLSYLFDGWIHSVCKYSRRQLTKASDRLPAFAALAENFAGILGSETTGKYLAGLWESDLPAQLLWFRPESEAEAEAEGAASAIESGPTWSWASLNGPVGFLTLSSLMCDTRARYIHSDMKHQDENYEYSKVEFGHLYLNGRLQIAYWDGEDLWQIVTGRESLPFLVHWDRSSSDYPTIIWCFEIADSHGLLLVMEKEKHFRRVGCFECPPSRQSSEHAEEWFNEVKPDTISIC
jgi:hypothetical protein